MKQSKYEQHILQFEKQFLPRHEPQLENEIHMHTLTGLTEEPYPSKSVKEIQMQQIQIKSLSEIKESVLCENSTSNKAETSQSKTITNKKIFKFNIVKFILEIIIAYILTISFFYLSQLTGFPFFQCITLFNITSFFSDTCSYFFILLGLPIIIGGHFLNVEVIVWPSIAICYFSTYLIRETFKPRILWLAQAVLLGIYGYMILPLIYGSFQSSQKYSFFYIFPFINSAIKFTNVCLKHFIKNPCVFLCELQLFMLGIEYSILLKISPAEIQFWFIVVMLTLDIINNRYKMLWLGLRYLTKIRTDFENEHEDASSKQIKFAKFSPSSNTLNQITSGFICLHSFHILILIYLLLGLQLGTSFNGTLIKFSLDDIHSTYLPVIVFLFFTGYELLSLLKVKNREDLLIFGNEDNSWKMLVRRSVSHCTGFWLFYLGFIIPLSLTQ